MTTNREVLNGPLYKIFSLVLFRRITLRQLIAFRKLNLQLITVLALLDRTARNVKMSNKLLREKQLQYRQFHSLD